MNVFNMQDINEESKSILKNNDVKLGLPNPSSLEAPMYYYSMEDIPNHNQTQ